jgi:uncharacterized membrane protein YdbT with pleckstrin-like domain
MGYPTRLLGEGESIAFEMRPHWRSLVMPAIILIATVALAGFLIGYLDPDGFQGGLRTAVWVIALLIIVVFTVRPFLIWLTTQYVFTSRRVIVRTGLLSRAGRDMPLSRVNNVTFDKTPIERVLNCGTLTIQSAAEQGTLVIRSVPNVESIQRDIYRLFEEDDARRRGTLGQQGQPGFPGQQGPTGPGQALPNDGT